MVRRYFRGWGWGLRTHHVLGAGFLASAIGAYPIAARLGLAPTSVSSAVGWFNSAAPVVESEVQSATNNPTEFGKTLPSKVVNAVETIASQAAAANGFPTNFQTSGYPNTGFANNGYPQNGFQNNSAAPYGAPPYGAPPNGAAPNGAVPYGFVNNATGDISCFFSPAGGCTEACVNEIRQARQQILVQAYSFTSVPIANALVEAHNRGVSVYIVLDKSQKTEQYSGADFVAHAGIPTLIDSMHAIAHNKIMLIDRQTIITGSFNFTTSAEKSNAENLLVIRNRPDLYQTYENNFRHHYEHSQPYQGRGAASQPAQPHSHSPTTNFGSPSNVGPTGYQPNTGYPPNNQPSNGYPAGYQPASGYPAGNQFESPSGPYPQTASPSNPSGGNRF